MAEIETDSENLSFLNQEEEMENIKNMCRMNVWF
jgi:hypothetical protein